MPQLKVGIYFTITKDDLLRRFDECLNEVENGAEFIITENGKEIARLVPAKKNE